VLGEVVAENHKGAKEAWNKGLKGVIHYSDETRAKMSAMRMGMRHTPEWNANIGKGNKDKVRTPEMRKQWSEAHKKLDIHRELVWQMQDAIKAKWADPDFKVKMRKIHKKNWQNPERREVQHQSLVEMWQRPGQKEKFLATMAEKWADEEFRERRLDELMSGWNVQPNKPESFILELLNELYPNEWDYTGDGKVRLGGRSPDFCNINGQKKIISFHGLWWHLWKFQKDNPDYTREDAELRDINHYKQFGYDVLIIWEDELDDLDKVTEKIKVFAEVKSH